MVFIQTVLKYEAVIQKLFFFSYSAAFLYIVKVLRYIENAKELVCRSLKDSSNKFLFIELLLNKLVHEKLPLGKLNLRVFLC